MGGFAAQKAASINLRHRSFSLVLASVLLFLLFAGLVSAPASGSSTTDGSSGSNVFAPPAGYVHRPLVEFFTGLSCPICMEGPHQDMETIAQEGKTEEVPYTMVTFHELNGGNRDALRTEKSEERMRHYQPGVSGTPDAEFDGGYIELGGITSPGGDVSYSNAKSAVESCKTRYERQPSDILRPGQTLLNPFKYVSLEVMEIYQGGSLGVTVTVDYLGLETLVRTEPLNAELYVFVCEDNVPAYSLSLDEVVINNNVFRGYAIESESLSLAVGESTTVSGGWEIPEKVEVPVKPQDLYAVVAVFDTGDTDSEEGNSGNNANTPRCIQSATARSTAHDLGNSPPKITNIRASQGSKGIEVTAEITDDEGLMSAFVIYSKDKSGLNWSAEPMELAGEEICDDSGVCYAYGSGQASASFSPPEGWNGTYYILATDSQGLPVVSQRQVATGLVSKDDSEGLPLGNEDIMLPLIISVGIIIFILAIYMGVKKSQSTTGKRTGSRWTAVIAVLALVVALAAAGFYLVGSSTTEDAPEFTVTSTEGEKISLSDYRGQVVLLDIMSTTCSGCEEAMDVLLDIYPEYKDNAVFLSVTVDLDDSTQVLSDYKEDHNAAWNFARDEEKEVFTGYGASQIPRIIIIDAEGKITYDHLGAPPADELKGKLDDTIAQKASPVGIYTFSGTFGLVIISILAGVGMFFSPCAFPLLPGYISYTLGREDLGGRAGEGVKIGAIASSGIVLLFMTIGVLVALAGHAVSRYFVLLEPIIGAALIILGVILFLQIPIPLGRLTSHVKQAFKGRSKAGGPGYSTSGDMSAHSEKKGVSGFFFYGIGYGAGAASCTAPILIALIMIGLTTGGFMGAMLMFLIFSLSMATLMILFTVLAVVGGQKVFAKYTRAMKHIERGSAVVLIVVGVYFVWAYLSIAVF